MTALLVLNCNSSPGCLMKEYARKRVYKHVVQTFFCRTHSFNPQMFHWVIYYMLGTVRGTGERDVNNPILIFILYLARSNLTISFSYLKREREHFLSSILRVTINPAKKKKVSDVKSCLTLCHPMDCSPPGSSVHGILQARILEWVAIPFSRGSSWPREQTHVSCIAGGFFTVLAIKEA